MTLDAATTLNFQLAAPYVVGGGSSDLLAITGNLSLNGTLAISADSAFATGGYTLITYTGTLSGAGLTVGTSVPGGYNYPLSVGQGQVNVAVSTWALGDVNHDGKLDSTDIDAIYQHLGSVATNLHLIQYDVNGDNLVSQADVTWELQNVFHTSYADANLDCKVDFYDFQVLLYHWLATGLGWAGGDFNGDGVVDYGDFQILLDYWNPVGIGLGPAMMQASQASTSVATSTTAAATTTTTSATTTTSTTPSSGATDSSSTTSADVATASPSSATASAATTVSPSLVASATPDPAVAPAPSLAVSPTASLAVSATASLVVSPAATLAGSAANSAATVTVTSTGAATAGRPATSESVWPPSSDDSQTDLPGPLHRPLSRPPHDGGLRDHV